MHRIFTARFLAADIVLRLKQSAQSRLERRGRNHPAGQIINRDKAGRGKKAARGKKQDKLILTKQNLNLFYIFKYIFSQGCDLCVIFTVIHGNKIQIYLFHYLYLWKKINKTAPENKISCLV